MSQSGDHRGCSEAVHTLLVLGPTGFLPVEAEATGLRDKGFLPPPPAQPPPVGPREELGVGLCEDPALSVPVEAQTNGGASESPRARHSFQDKVEAKRFEIPQPRPYQKPVALPREGSGAPPGLPEATGAEVEEEEPFQLGQQSRQPASCSATCARSLPRAARAPT